MRTIIHTRGDDYPKCAILLLRRPMQLLCSLRDTKWHVADGVRVILHPKDVHILYEKRVRIAYWILSFGYGHSISSTCIPKGKHGGPWSSGPANSCVVDLKTPFRRPSSSLNLSLEYMEGKRAATTIWWNDLVCNHKSGVISYIK